MRFISLLVVAAVAMGCSSDGDSEQPTVEFVMDVIGFEPDMGDVPLEGVAVCEFETDNCDISDAMGFVTLMLPANSEILLTVEKEGYTPTLSPQLTGDQDSDELRTALLTEETSALLAGVLGVPYPLDAGVVAISALYQPLRAEDNGIAGITFATESFTPYYLNEMGFPTFELSATTAPDGVGGFVEMPDGDYEVTIGGDAINCEIASAWPGNSDDTIRVPAAAGFFTQAFIACDEPDTP